MSNTLKWAQYPEADVVSYKLYRSIVGFMANDVPVAVDTKTLILKLNGGISQTFTFDGTPIVAKINATIVGGRAYPSLMTPSMFFVRSDVREEPGSVEILGGTALGDLGLTARLITEKSEDLLIGTVLAPVNPNDMLEFVDQDGILLDNYAISTIDSLSDESLKTSYRKPIGSTGSICVIEGLVTDLQGVRIPDIEVIVTAQLQPQLTILSTPITILTGQDGRFSIPLLQGYIVRFEIPAINFIRMITVPAQSYAFLSDIPVDEDYNFNTNANS